MATKFKKSQKERQFVTIEHYKQLPQRIMLFFSKT